MGHFVRHFVKMPVSASSKSSSAPVSGQLGQVKMPELLQEPIKVVLSALEKKQRNLEKRKLKLKEYEKKMHQGADLNEDQSKAASDLILVENSLSTVADFRKNLVILEQEFTKLSKMDAKRIKIETERQLQVRAAQLSRQFMEVQTILGSFNDEVRQDFLTGENGACLLSEDDLAKLDQIYTLINPTDNNNKLSDIVGRCSAHILSLIEERDAIAYDDITYKDVCDVLSKIKECGYFEKEKVSSAEEDDNQTVQDAFEEESIEVVCEKEFSQEEVLENEVSPNLESDSNFSVEEPIDQYEIVPCDEDIQLHTTALVYTNSNEQQPEVNGCDRGVTLPPEIDDKCDGEAIDFFGDDTDQTDEDLEANQPQPTCEAEPKVITEPQPMEFTPSLNLSEHTHSDQIDETSPILNAGSPEFIPRNIQSTQNSNNPIANDINGWQEEKEIPWQSVDNRRNDNRRARGSRGQTGRGDSRGGRGGGYRGSGDNDAARRGRGGGNIRGNTGYRGDGNRGRGGRSEGNRGSYRGGYNSDRGGRGGNRGGQNQY